MPIARSTVARYTGRALAGGPGYSIDFTAAAIQDPLSDGGIWTNASQGTGGNVAVTDKSSMRVALASDGSTKIAQHMLNAIDWQGLGRLYEDSFAFVPGVSASGPIQVTARIWKAAGYNPVDNHELEIILGCKSTGSTNSKWVECLHSSGGNDIIVLDGVASNFNLVGGSTGSVGAPVHNSLFRGRLDRSVNPHRVQWWVDTTGVGLSFVLACDSNDGGANKSLITNMGDGAGIAAFRRPGDTNSAAMGFSSFFVESV